MDMGPIIDCTDRQEFQVIREDDGQIVNGRRVRGRTTAFRGFGSIQPVTAKTLERLGINTKTSETRQIFTTCPLRTADVKCRQLADKIRFDGENWRVLAVEPWQAQGNYIRAVCERVGQ